jgi:dihydrofolate reductase
MTTGLTLIAALARNGVIGCNNRLPWRLPADLQFFKQTTMGKPLLMGRRTWESIGRPLPGRTMIILSGHPGYLAAGCKVAHSLDDALTLPGTVPELMVIGGAALYEQTLPLADQLVLTRIEAEIAGDVWFPTWDQRDWRLVWEEAHAADADQAWPYRFQRWERLNTRSRAA